MSIAMHQSHDPRQLLGQTLMLVARDFQARLDRDLQRRGVQGIGARHRSIFLFLGRNGPSRAVDLARAADIRPQSMMKIVHELESVGLVERHVDPADSRAKLIGFTDSGRQLISELSQSTETVWQEYAAILGPDELERAMQQLNKLVQAGEQYDE